MKGKNAIEFQIVGILFDDLLEELNLSIFHGIFRFLPVLIEILVKTSFFFHFMHLLGYKTVSLSMKAILCSNLEKSVCRILRKFGNFRVTFNYS